MNAHDFSLATTMDDQGAASAFERDLVAGLSLPQRCVSPKYFYDARGSALFDRICTLPEYYLTRVERSILSRHAAEMARTLGGGVELIEFGAGSLDKVRLLLDAFEPDDMPAAYVPIDISGAHLAAAANELRAAYPALAVRPVVADYTRLTALPATAQGGRGRRVGFFPGSTLGNFEPAEALAFLRSAAQLLRGGGLLLGIDLVKDPQRLHAAYNDRDGVTAEFNRNLLHRANRELGANFEPQSFAHYAFYSPVLKRIEMHLVSMRAQVVAFGGHRFVFAEGESIHTENSHKYSTDSLEHLARVAGFSPAARWRDEERSFCVYWLEAPPQA